MSYIFPLIVEDGEFEIKNQDQNINCRSSNSMLLQMTNISVGPSSTKLMAFLVRLLHRYRLASAHHKLIFWLFLVLSASPRIQHLRPYRYKASSLRFCFMVAAICMQQNEHATTAAHRTNRIIWILPISFNIPPRQYDHPQQYAFQRKHN